MSWRVTLTCTRAEAAAVPDSDSLFAIVETPPVIVADILGIGSIEADPEQDEPGVKVLHLPFGGFLLFVEAPC